MTKSLPLVGRFLLVEDNTEDAVALSALLEHHRPVEHVSSLGEARSRLQHTSYIGWVFDMRLPDGDGVRALYELRQRLGEQPPVAVVTAAPLSRSLILEAMAVGRLLPKPENDSPRSFLQIRALRRWMTAGSLECPMSSAISTPAIVRFSSAVTRQSSILPGFRSSAARFSARMATRCLASLSGCAIN